MQNSLLTSKTNEWNTPQDFYEMWNDRYNFTLDPCATRENAKCSKFFTEEQDGLKQSWKDEIVFMNPPYGRQISKWIKKAHDESINNNAVVVCLIPARTDTSYWHDYIFDKANIIYLRGRLYFGNGKGPAPFPSAIVIFDNKMCRCTMCHKF